MLYARCAYCGYTAPLNCSGRFMPHPTMFVEATAMGPTCPACGPLPPVFTCPFFHTQYLYLQGSSQMPQAGYTYAAVVQAPAGASDHALSKAFGDFFGNAGSAFGKGAAEALFGGYS